MVVQHNLTAMNSNRMLNLTVKSQADSTEKLSSGYKINRAADDAAGLSISEKMRKQIRGLTQASANAQDGISAVQTAEGALNEVQDMLQRMNELAVKAANGTNSVDDRSYIQNEITQLETEIDRVAETTKFNETYLLKGDKLADKEYELKYKEIPNTTSDPTFDATAIDTGITSSATLICDGTDWYDTTDLTTAVDIGDYGITLDGNEQVGDIIEFTYAGAGGADSTIEYKESTIDKFGLALYDGNGNRVPANGLENYFDFDGTSISLKDGAKLYLDEAATLEYSGEIPAVDDLIEQTQTKTAALELKLHVGADATSNNQISVKLEALTAHGIGIENLKVDGPDDTNALYAINVIKEAIQKISTQRSALGAVQNRLDHTINNLDNVVENTTSAESSIRDTDMATEMVKYSNNNILAQAGQAMLAQANQANQGVLSLLQ